MKRTSEENEECSLVGTLCHLDRSTEDKAEELRTMGNERKCALLIRKSTTPCIELDALHSFLDGFKALQNAKCVTSK